MPTPLGRFGSRCEERLTRADAQVERPTPGQLVSQYAEGLDTLEKVAQQLGRAIHKALRTSPWTPTAQRFAVEVTPDYAAMWYVVRVSSEHLDGREVPPAKTYVVEDEVLAAHTTSVPAFHDWVKAVADRLRIVFRPAPISLLLDSPEETNKRLWSHHVILQKAGEELRSFGLRQHNPEDRAPSETEKQAAIDSIRKAMGDV